MTKEKDKIFKSNERNYSFGISQKAIIYNSEEDKYLLLKSKDEYFSQKYGPWDMAGGTMNPGETFRETLEREIKEEVGEIDYEFINLVAYEKILNSDGKEKIFLGNLVRWLGKEIQISDEHTNYKWESYKNITEGKEYKPWLKNFIEKAQKYIENQKSIDGWKRCQADFENYRKMQAEERRQLSSFASENMILQLLPILDNFHASTDHIPEDARNGAWVVGIMHIQKQLETFLKDNGVEEIETKEGDKFDPEIHEALSHGTHNIEHGTKKSEDKVKKIVAKGYKIGGKVIRAVRVIVN